jgi:hypothetical protein
MDSGCNGLSDAPLWGGCYLAEFPIIHINAAVQQLGKAMLTKYSENHKIGVEWSLILFQKEYVYECCFEEGFLSCPN